MKGPKKNLDGITLEDIAPEDGGQNNNFTINILNQASIDAAGFEPLSSLPPGKTYPQAVIDDIKEAAIDRCNARRQEAAEGNPNLSEAGAFIASDGIYEVHWEAKAQHLCRYQRIYLEGEDGSPGHNDIFELLSNTPDLTVVGRPSGAKGGIRVGEGRVGHLRGRSESDRGADKREASIDGNHRSSAR